MSVPGAASRGDAIEFNQKPNDESIRRRGCIRNPAPSQIRRVSQMTVLAFLMEAVIAANPDLPNKAGLPISPPPAVPSYPPSWYYNPYTQGIVPLPQRGGD
jgi:hypothetical protein